MVVVQNSFFRERPFFANKMLLSQKFCGLSVYLSRNPYWATMLLMKIHSSPAKLRRIIIDHFLIPLCTCS